MNARNIFYLRIKTVSRIVELEMEKQHVSKMLDVNQRIHVGCNCNISYQNTVLSEVVLDDLTAKISKEITYLAELDYRIETILNQLPNERWVDILRLRFIANIKPVIIGEEKSLSQRTIYRNIESAFVWIDDHFDYLF